MRKEEDVVIKIPLTRGKFAIVDPANYWIVLKPFSWHAVPNRTKHTTRWYAATGIKRNGKWTTLFMHRLIMDATPGIQVDHINGDGLDNRRCNLRLATGSQNQHNRRKGSGSSRYKGVYWNKRERKWRASVQITGKNLHAGYFKREIDAARAYDRMALYYFRNRALLNFPREDYR